MIAMAASASTTAKRDGTTFFASEAKALLSVLPELRAFDDQGVAQFLNYGSTLDGRTLFRNVQLLPGGSLWTFDGTASGVRNQYFRPAVWESLPTLESNVFDSKFEETFRRVLPGYLRSDSNIGISLTGGLDTRMIMACIPDGGVKPVCYTFGGLTGETQDATIGGPGGSHVRTRAPYIAYWRGFPFELRSLRRSHGVRYGWICRRVGCTRNILYRASEAAIPCSIDRKFRKRDSSRRVDT